MTINEIMGEHFITDDFEIFISDANGNEIEDVDWDAVCWGYEIDRMNHACFFYIF